MKWIKNLVIGVSLMAIVGACLKQPEYSVIPEITFNQIYFVKGDLTKGVSDSLVLKFDFKDGDGDLGVGSLDSSSSLNYFNPWYYAYRTTDFQIGYTNDRTITLPTGYKWINYQVKKKVAQFDTLPDINCSNWEQINNTSGSVSDTLYITQNAKAYNINVDLYTKDGSGQYVKFNPATYFTFPGCNPNLFRGTFKDLSSDRGKNSPIEGTFRYNIQSAALNLIFGSKTLMIRVYILDRQFHQSNVIEYKDFRLSDITKG